MAIQVARSFGKVLTVTFLLIFSQQSFSMELAKRLYDGGSDLTCKVGGYVFGAAQKNPKVALGAGFLGGLVLTGFTSYRLGNRNKQKEIKEARLASRAAGIGQGKNEQGEAVTEYLKDDNKPLSDELKKLLVEKLKAVQEESKDRIYFAFEQAVQSKLEKSVPEGDKKDPTKLVTSVYDAGYNAGLEAYLAKPKLKETENQKLKKKIQELENPKENPEEKKE